MRQGDETVTAGAEGATRDSLTVDQTCELSPEGKKQAGGVLGGASHGPAAPTVGVGLNYNDQLTTG